MLKVAVGVLINSDQKILVALRSVSQEHGNLWEFPGGKIESGENAYEALCRELLEEIGISVLEAEPLIKLKHSYPSYEVELDTWRVIRYEGKPQGLESQPLAWVSLSELKELKLPGANHPIVEAIEVLLLSNP